MRWAAATSAFVLLAACTTAAPEPEAAYDPSRIEPVVLDRMADCTTVHGYDPAATTAAEDALAPGERDWRACVYGAIEAEVLPETRVPESYRRLIAEDRAMTDAIADGRLSRSSREARLAELAADIRAAEAAAVIASDPGTAEQAASERTAFVRRMVNDLR